MKDHSAQAPSPQLSEELTTLLDGEMRIEDFVATIVHEAAQPLTTIQLLAAAMRGKGQDMPEDVRAGLLTNIEDQARFLQDLSNWMLRPFARDTVIFDDLIASAAENCRALAPDHKLTVTLDSGAVKVDCETVRVEASVRNLVKNAVASSAPGSEIEIATRTDDQYAVLSISDRGHGIPQAEWRKVFIAHHRLADNPAEGEGLGLMIVASCAKQHNGFARVAASSPNGTTIEFAIRAGV
ncbi:MAG: ATP-binding protein [Solirubrobacterales bacterium]